VAKVNGSYVGWLIQPAKIDLDSWTTGGLTPDEEQRRDLLEILDDQYQCKLTIIASQLPTTH